MRRAARSSNEKVRSVLSHRQATIPDQPPAAQNGHSRAAKPHDGSTCGVP